MENNYKQIQSGVDAILNTKTLVRRKRRSISEKKKVFEYKDKISDPLLLINK